MLTGIHSLWASEFTQLQWSMQFPHTNVDWTAYLPTKRFRCLVAMEWMRIVPICTWKPKWLIGIMMNEGSIHGSSHSQNYHRNCTWINCYFLAVWESSPPDTMPLWKSVWPNGVSEKSTFATRNTQKQFSTFSITVKHRSLKLQWPDSYHMHTTGVFLSLTVLIN